MILLLLMLSQALPQQPQASVRQLGPDAFEILIAGLEADDRQSQAEAAQVAATVCGEKQPIMGDFEAKRQVKAGADGKHEPATFRQRIKCQMPDNSEAPPQRPAVKPSPADEANARNAIKSFLAARNEGRTDAAWAMLAASFREQLSRKSWEQQNTTRRSSFGHNLETRIVKLTWYANPPRSWIRSIRSRGLRR